MSVGISVLCWAFCIRISVSLDLSLCFCTNSTKHSAISSILFSSLKLLAYLMSLYQPRSQQEINWITEQSIMKGLITKRVSSVWRNCKEWHRIRGPAIAERWYYSWREEGLPYHCIEPGWTNMGPQTKYPRLIAFPPCWYLSLLNTGMLMNTFFWASLSINSQNGGKGM